jgi:hypothetical protein
MLYVWLILLVLTNAIWWALGFFALPGNWLMIIATSLFAWWKWDDQVFSVYTLFFIVFLAVIGEIIEFFAGMGGARKAGASWLASIGALVGTLIGAIAGTFLIPVPLLGTLIGACIGAGVAAIGVETMAGKKPEVSLKSGIGAGFGVFVGTASKLAIGGLIWLAIAIAAFWK